MAPRQIAVVGAGVVGVATAYILARSGHRVTLIDARPGPGEGASMGNAAQLSWAYGDAMASPSFIRHLPGIALGRDPSFRIEWQLDPGFFLWGLRFVLNGLESRWWANTAAILALAEQSRQELASLLAETDLPFSYRVAGKLHLYPDRASFDAARSTVAKNRARPRPAHDRPRCRDANRARPRPLCRRDRRAIHTPATRWATPTPSAAPSPTTSCTSTV